MLVKGIPGFIELTVTQIPWQAVIFQFEEIWPWSVETQPSRHSLIYRPQLEDKQMKGRE